MEQQIEKVDIWKSLGFFRHWRWGVLVSLVVFIAAVTLALLAIQDLYEAACVLRVRTEEEMLLETTMKQDPKITSTIAHMEARMLNRRFVIEAAEKARILARLGDKANDERQLDLLYHRLKKQVKLVPSGEELVMISYKDEDSNAAYIFVDELVSRFRNNILKNKDDTYESQLRNKLDERSKIDNQLAVKTRQYDDYLRRNHSRMYDLHIIKQRELAILEGELNKTDRDLKAAKEMRDYWASSLKDIPETLPQPAFLGRQDITRSHIEKQLATLKVTLEQMRVTYTNEHPKMKTVEELIRSLEDELAKSFQVEEADRYRRNPDFDKARLAFVEKEVEVEQLTTQQNDIQKRRDTLRADLDIMPEIRVKIEEFTRDISHLERLQRNAVEDHHKAASMLEDSRKIQYFDYARALEKSETPSSRKLIVIMMGFFAALAAGIGAMFGIEYVDQSFTDVNEARQFLMIPALGVIPTITTRSDRRRRLAFRLLMLLVVAGISTGTVALYLYVPAVALFADNLGVDIVSRLQGLFRL